MDRGDGATIEKCPTCGNIIDSKSKVENEIKRANASMKRFTNKLKGKNALFSKRS